MPDHVPQRLIQQQEAIIESNRDIRRSIEELIHQVEMRGRCLFEPVEPGTVRTVNITKFKKQIDATKDQGVTKALAKLLRVELAVEAMAYEDARVERRGAPENDQVDAETFDTLSTIIWDYHKSLVDKVSKRAGLVREFINDVNEAIKDGKAHDMTSLLNAGPVSEPQRLKPNQLASAAIAGHFGPLHDVFFRALDSANGLTASRVGGRPLVTLSSLNQGLA